MLCVCSALGVKDFGVCTVTPWGMANPTQVPAHNHSCGLFPQGGCETVASQLCGSPASIRASYVDEMASPPGTSAAICLGGVQSQAWW